LLVIKTFSQLKTFEEYNSQTVVAMPFFAFEFFGHRSASGALVLGKCNSPRSVCLYKEAHWLQD